ncbi:MAG TPA: hypothetical protein VF799_04940 [Geobacteraceae bacterium]
MESCLRNIGSSPHPLGNSIWLRWENGAPALYPWVRIVRRKRTFPVAPDDGVVVAEKSAALFQAGSEIAAELDSGTIPGSLGQLFVDSGIVLCCDALVEKDGSGAGWRITDGERLFILAAGAGRITAYTGGPFSHLDKKLKSETVYYYAFFPFRQEPLEYVVDKGLRTAAMATGPYGAAEQMYELLPRIYHRYDTVLSHHVAESDREKGELRRLLGIPGSQLDQLRSFAASTLDCLDVEKVDGRLLPLLGEWIGWQTDFRNELGLQRNEVENAPFIYQTTGLIPNAEAAVKRISGWECHTKEFLHNVFLSNRPERLNLWLKEKTGTGWSEPTAPFSLDYAFEGRGATVTDGEGVAWLFYHTYRERPPRDGSGRYLACNIWCKRFAGGAWSGSEPVTDRVGIDKHPCAALHEGGIWLFFSVYDEASGKWRIECRVRGGDVWIAAGSPAAPAEALPFGTDGVERKRPLAAADYQGGLWLFWQEREEGGWRMKYNHRAASHWQLSSPALFPQADGAMEDPFLLSDGGARTLHLFWAQPGDDGKKVIACSCKKSIDPALSDWDGAVQPLAGDPGSDYDDREPAALLTDSGMELFFSSNRGGSWSIWQSRFDPASEDWGSAEQLTLGPYSQRDPLVMEIGGAAALLYRSNQSVTYASGVYRATGTTDFRYSGSTSADSRNAPKNELYEQYEDFLRYSYDAGRDDDNWYARDTVGMYLKAGSGDPALISRNRGIISQLLAEILPIQVRSIFCIETVHEERYGFPGPDAFTDRLTGPAKEEYAGITEARTDSIGEWLRLYACDCVSGRYTDRHSADCAADPPDTRSRSWHTGLDGE